MSTDSTPAVEPGDAVATTARTPLWLTVALAILFGLFFAYDVFEALGNLLGIADFAQSLDSSIQALGWVLLIAAMVLPVAIFAVAFSLGRKRAPLAQAAIYVAGLGLSAVLSLDVIAAFARWLPIV